MPIEQLQPQQFVDLFGDANIPATPGSATPKFGMDVDKGTDIFEKLEDKIEDKVEDIVDDPNKVDDKEDKAEDKVDGDILEPVTKVGRKPKYDFSDTSGYFADRLKSGKFVSVVQEDENGNQVDFVPKTPEEFDEVIDLQVNYKLEQKAKDLENEWYSTKSPAWQAVAKFADMTDDPTEIIPFLQGIRTVESVENLDPTDIAGAEKIVRVGLQQRGEDDEVIKEQIDALKTTDKLVATAEKYKPLILNREKQQLSQMLAEKRQQEIEYVQMVSSIRENAIKTIEAPIFGKQKLKQEEKAAIYDLIAEPSRETKGYRIYSAIDECYQKGEFDKLRKIAMILAKEEALVGYISVGASDKTAKDLQTKLRVADKSHATSSGNDDPNGEDKRVIQRNVYSQTPRFGR